MHALIWAAAWAAVAVAGIGLWNLYRTGALLDPGYPGQTFLWNTAKPYIGLFGSLASPSFGLFVFFPAAVVGLWGVGVSALGVLFDYQRGWRDLWDVGAKPEQILWDPHFSIVGAHLRLLRQWGNGLIGPDLYLVHKLGFWWAPVFAAGLSLVAGVWAALRVRLALKRDGV